MELTQIRYFYEAAITENLSRAAERLHISQPSLTKSIKKLESELDTELFERNGHKIILNENGRIFLKEITPLLSKLDDIYDRMAGSVSKKRELVTVGISGVSNLLDNAIKSFYDDHPEINVDVRCHIDRLEHIEITDYDMLLYSSMDERFKKYKGYKLADDPLMLVVFKGHPLYNQKYYDAAELNGEIFVGMREDGIHSESLNMLLRKRVNIEEKVITGDILNQMNLVEAGLGISVAFKSECGFIKGGNLHLIEPADKSLFRNMMVCFKRDHLLSEAGVVLKDYMLRLFKY